MALPLRKRTVHFYEIHLQAHTRADIKKPSSASLPELLAAVKKLAGPSSLPINVAGSHSVRTTLQDWRYDTAGDYYELLLNRADVGVSDTALRDFDTSKLRTAGKTKREGVEISAHVIIRPNNDGQTALVLMTMGAAIGPGRIERLLRQLVKAASGVPANRHLFNFDQPSGAKDAKGKPVQYKVRYGFAVYGCQGQTLKDALKAGEFESMELVAYDHAKFDAGGTFQTQERTLKVSAPNPAAITSASIINGIRSFLQSSPQPYENLRVRYKTPAGRSTSTTLAISDLDAAFTLKENIEFQTDVQEQQMRLNSTILEQMRPLLARVPK